MAKMTQKERLLRWFKDNETITRAEAFNELGIAELSSRIGELERDGYLFARETIQRTNRYGEVINLTRYSLRRQNNEQRQIYPGTDRAR